MPLVVVLAVGFLLLRKLRRPRRLDIRRREEFAERLRIALAEGEGHATSTP